MWRDCGDLEMDEKPKPGNRPAAVASADQNRETIDSMLERHGEPRGTPDGQSTRRIDEELMAILDVPGAWTGHGPGGAVVFAADTLRGAVEKAIVYLSTNQVVVALRLQNNGSVIIFQNQIESLAQAIG
jgi:hypothetical protein